MKGAKKRRRKEVKETSAPLQMSCMVPFASLLTKNVAVGLANKADRTVYDVQYTEYRPTCRFFGGSDLQFPVGRS